MADLVNLMSVLSEKINARQESVRLLLAGSAILVPDGVAPRLHDIYLAAKSDDTFLQNLYNLLFEDEAVNAEGWTTWASAVSNGLASVFGTVDAANKASSSSDSDAINALKELAALNAGNNGGSGSSNTSSSTSSVLKWVGIGVGVIVVVVVIILVVKANKK